MPVANPRAPEYRPLPRRVGVLIFARAPVPGRCKTRLAGRYGNRRAAALYAALLEHTVATVSRAVPRAVTLVCAPDPGHPCFVRLSRRYGVRRVRQSRGSLGARMHAAIRAGLRRHAAVVLMGSDQPLLGDDWLAEAAAVVEDPDAAWLAPAVDGGYWAIGLARPEARLFRGLPWSTSRVARQTAQRMKRAGLRPILHAPRPDVDDGRDWQTLPVRMRSKLARRATMPARQR